MIRAIVFDLDDTLFPEHQFVLSGLRTVGEWVSTYLSRPGFYAKAEQLFREGRRGNIFNLALDQLGMVYDQKLIANLIDVYRNHKPNLSLYEDASWAIDYYKGKKQLGILTDGYLETQRNKVEALGLSEIFEAIVYSDEFGREHWKPSEIPYRKLMEKLTCNGDECVYIADNPGKDFISARALGWQTIHICRKGGEYAHLIAETHHDANNRIVSLFQLKELIP